MACRDLPAYLSIPRYTRCGLCVELCPAGNLVLKDGLPRESGLCEFCMRCYDFCPVSALMFYGKPHMERRGVPYRGPEPGFDPASLRNDYAEYRSNAPP